MRDHAARGPDGGLAAGRVAPVGSVAARRPEYEGSVTTWRAARAATPLGARGPPPSTRGRHSSSDSHPAPRSPAHAGNVSRRTPPPVTGAPVRSEAQAHHERGAHARPARRAERR
jgi:hypothetical protein